MAQELAEARISFNILKDTNGHNTSRVVNSQLQTTRVPTNSLPVKINSFNQLPSINTSTNNHLKPNHNSAVTRSRSINDTTRTSNYR